MGINSPGSITMLLFLFSPFKIKIFLINKILICRPPNVFTVFRLPSSLCHPVFRNRNKVFSEILSFFSFHKHIHNISAHALFVPKVLHLRINNRYNAKHGKDKKQLLSVPELSCNLDHRALIWIIKKTHRRLKPT